MEFLFIGILGLAMGIITSISGGAGVFAIPTMLALGIPPINVLALNRASDVGVGFGAFWKYHHSKNINWRLVTMIVIPLGIGAWLGSNVVIQIPKEYLSYIILFGVTVGIFFLLKPVTPSPETEKKSWSHWGLFFLFLAGFWSGCFGMAGATFAVLSLVYFFRLSYLEARGTDIAATIPEATISTLVLFSGSTVSLALMATMFLSSIAGAWIGSHLAVKHGSSFIKKMMVGIAVVMMIKVVIDVLG